MAFYQKGDVRIAYEETGKGFPLLIISGGGLNSTIQWAKTNAPFNAMEVFKDEYRCVVTDLRNAHGGHRKDRQELDLDPSMEISAADPGEVPSGNLPRGPGR